jgi:hypothetical protein
MRLLRWMDVFAWSFGSGTSGSIAAAGEVQRRHVLLLLRVAATEIAGFLSPLSSPGFSWYLGNPR